MRFLTEYRKMRKAAESSRTTAGRKYPAFILDNLDEIIALIEVATHLDKKYYDPALRQALERLNHGARD